MRSGNKDNSVLLNVKCQLLVDSIVSIVHSATIHCIDLTFAAQCKL